MQKLILALALLSGVSAFAPRSTRRLAATKAFAPRESVALASTLAEPPKVAATVQDEVFPGVADCPWTQWGNKDVIIKEERALPAPAEFAPEWKKADVLSADATLEEELAYFRSFKGTAKSLLHKYGAIIFRGFEMTKTPEGFQKFYLALGMDPCEDPLSSVAGRDAVDKKSGLYEAVNKESRSKYFVGMHNEQVGTRSPGRAAFVCLKPADEGGEFLIADGRKVFRDMDEKLVEEMYEKQVKFIAAEIPLGFMEAIHPAVRSFLEPPLLGFAEKMAKSKVDFDIDLIWDEDNEGKPCIHAIAPAQPPVVRHPETGEAVWFCNAHSHSDYLRQQREKRDGTVDLAETDGASRLNRTDIRFGDLSKFTDADLDGLDEVVMKNLKWVKMTKGDVVLLDNYNTMHGRNIFSGVRKHAVTWFK